MQQRIKVKKQIENDSLTALLNRGTAVKKITERLAGKECSIYSLLAMIDVDKFKEINDTYGHQFGDQVLSDIGRILASITGEEDVCGRMGGDEFILFLSDIPSLDIAKKKLLEINNSIDKTYHTDTAVSVSIGAVYPCSCLEFETLYSEADSALYEAKKKERGGYVIKAGF